MVKQVDGCGILQLVWLRNVRFRPVADIRAVRVDPRCTTIKRDRRAILYGKVLGAAELPREVVDMLNSVIEALGRDPLVESVREHLVRFDEHA